MTTTLFATTYARITGILLVLAGVVGVMALSAGYIGLFSLGFLAIDQTHNVLHILLGAIGLYVGFASRPVLGPLAYARAFGVVYLLLGLVGFASASLYGLGTSLALNVETGENLLHVLLGGLGLVAGFVVVEPEAAARRIAGAAGVAYPPPTERHQPIEAAEGIGATYGEKLRAQGILELEDLLARDPGQVAQATGIEPTLVRKWHAMVQLQAVNGIGAQFSEHLVRAGVEGLADLARQQPAALQKKVHAYQQGLDVRVQGKAITRAMTADWIKQARAFVDQGLPEAPSAAWREGAPASA